MARPTSDLLRNIVKGSHTARARVTHVNDSVASFSQSLTPPGLQLTVLDGDVRMDSSATVRATLDCTVQARWGTLKPNGGELFVEYGVEIAGGRTEWVSLGYFGIDEVTQDEVNGPLHIQASDRMKQVERTEAVYNWVAPAGTTHSDFFRSLIWGQNPTTWFHPNAGALYYGAPEKDLIADYDMTTATIPYAVQLEKTFSEHLAEIADTIGKRFFFDYRGRPTVIDADVNTSVAPVTTIEAGPGGVLGGMRRRLTRDGVYNSAVSTGSQPTEDVPPSGWALFTESPSNSQYVTTPRGLSWYGPFGRVLKRYSSPLLTNSGQCISSSRTWLEKVKGLPYSLSFDMIADPTLEPLDVVRVRFPGLGPSNTPPPPGMGIDPAEEIHVIDSMVFPLTGGAMTVTTRDSWTDGWADSIA
ncbi:DUF5047 domain-containing protein [Pseudonocardia sp. WMMC193]|uniref:DUF5047 domain-containing protein n=1 Tax=Pseudonocardia sp. WMMC193 TaxID=2911965 RepID=UPI001F2573FB|nr:DUF5047 domain-containing protein [Pseudonocardia sp. WMMC193]MCF7548895.1 DUF5047 domain-containing protein [Pseudonocardia sp. WMMC193]